MILAWSVPIGILIGFLRGGRLGNLEHISLKMAWIIFIALALQLLIFPFGLPGGAILKVEPPLFDIIHLGSYAILALFVLLNIKEWALGLMGLGMFSNIVPIFLNGGMPTTKELMLTAGLITPEQAELLTCGQIIANNIIDCGEAKLGFLGDIFATPAWFPLANIFSIGDVVLVLGMIIFIQAKMQPMATPVESA